MDFFPTSFKNPPETVGPETGNYPNWQMHRGIIVYLKFALSTRPFRNYTSGNSAITWNIIQSSELLEFKILKKQT